MWLLLAASFPAFGQSLERIYPSFLSPGNDQPLDFALAGGLNNPQPANLDLNGDGSADLLIFDRDGNVLLPFLWVDGAFQFSPNFRDALPEMTAWVLVRDFNGDGVKDLFTYSALPGVDGIRAFKGYIREGSLAFQPVAAEGPGNLLRYALPGGGSTPVFISRIDYPEVADMDCDGDLDILTFNSSGGYIEFFQNRSVESGYGLDSLIFELGDDCWGGVFESGDGPELDLSESPGTCFGKEGKFPAVQVRHAGSTLLSLDADADGDQDLILGDLSFSNLNLLTNDGDCQTAWIGSQDIDFPGDLPVDLDFFPAAFLADITGDGKEELLVAPNADDGVNREVFWQYENAANDGEAPDWVFRRKDAWVDQMIDLGEGSNPAFADVDQDGLVDLVAGNGFLYDKENARKSSLSWFRNVGTPQEPAFRLEDGDFLSLQTAYPEVYALSPAFADLDGDGDLDVLVGEAFGGILMAENTAGKGRPMLFSNWTYPYMGIQVGQRSVPAVYDVNADGLPDLLIGERNGNINLFVNQGSADSPWFDPDPERPPNSAFWGEVDTRVPGSSLGNSAPLIVPGAERTLLLTGTQQGQLETYELTDGAAFPLLEADYGQLREGIQTRPALADIDADGYLEMAVGNRRGGLSFLQTDLPAAVSVGTRPVEESLAFRLSPNPASERTTVILPEGIVGPQAILRLYDSLGRLLRESRVSGQREPIQGGGLPAGVYFVELISGKKRGVRRWLLQP